MFTLPELLDNIPYPNRVACIRFLSMDKDIVDKAPGSSHNHQSWEGGYLDHITEAMNIGVVLYESLSKIRKLPFELNDALLAIFLHDAEKPWKYALGKDELQDPTLQTKGQRHDFRREIIEKYEFQLTDEHWNAIEFAEGEIHKYSNRERHMGRLAAFVHMCDVWSARGWHDEPRASSSP